MRLTTLSYGRDGRWSSSPDTGLDSERTLVLAFGCSDFLDDPAPLIELGHAHPRSTFVGCSTSGEIFGTTVSDGGLSVAVAAFDSARVRASTAPVHAADQSYAAGRRLAADLAAPDLASVLVLSDGLRVNGTALVSGLNDALPASVIVTGGLAGDGPRFERTWVLENRRPATGVVAAVGLYGDRLAIGSGSRGGWDIFGPERRITASRGNVLYRLDDTPALDLYKKYLGDRASGLPATALLFPLAIRPRAGDEGRLVRTILGVNEADQSMTFAGDMPEGWQAQLMKANFDRLIDGAAGAAVMTRGASMAGAATLAIAISCVGRRLVLGERTEEEVEATLDALPGGTSQVGFYSYGEIARGGVGSCDLHNQTMTLTTISES